MKTAITMFEFDSIREGLGIAYSTLIPSACEGVWRRMGETWTPVNHHGDRGDRGASLCGLTSLCARFAGRASSTAEATILGQPLIGGR